MTEKLNAIPVAPALVGEDVFPYWPCMLIVLFRYLPDLVRFWDWISVVCNRYCILFAVYVIFYAVGYLSTLLSY